MLVSVYHGFTRQLKIHILGSKSEHLRHFFLEFPDCRRCIELYNDGARKLMAAIVAGFVLDHIANNDSIQHFTLQYGVMRLDTSSALFLTNLDYRFKDLDETLDALRLTLTRSDKLEATRVNALHDADAALL